MTFLGTFGFCKRFLVSWYLQPGTKTYIFHAFDIDMLQMSVTHEETLIWGYTCNVCGNKFKIKWYMEIFCKKSTYIILVPSQRYQDFWRLLQNPKCPMNVFGFSNHTQRFTPPYYLDVDNPFEGLSSQNNAKNGVFRVRPESNLALSDNPVVGQP